MGKLANISGKETVKTFERLGWKKRGQVGDHFVMTKENERANLSIPLHKELAIGTLRRLIRDARISVDEFLEKL
jgi:predicted RNA binding protein YcfA (HicA-like mRNA interferase family)